MNETKIESWPGKVLVECTARVKLELTEFSNKIRKVQN